MGLPGPGAHVGRYEILQLVGKGGMGEVHRARDPELQRDVAVKVLFRGGRALCARIEREARALARLSHPNVVAVYDVGRSRGRSFIAMELIDGSTLGTWIHEQRPSADEIIDTLCAAGRGLRAAHAAGIIHRDFKPGNVLLGRDGRPRVTDFGLARAGASDSAGTSLPTHHVDSETSLTVDGTVVGTPPYMAPEQHAGGHIDARCDQFAFCITLYEALVGLRPYEGRSLEILAKAKLAHDPPWPEAIPRALIPVLRRGLAPDPNDRYATMTELVAAIEHTRRPARRRWWLSLAPLLALTAWVALPTAEPAASTDVPGHVVPPAADIAEQVAEVDRALGRAVALFLAGDRDEGIALAREARERADSLGYAPLQGRAAYQVGRLARRLNDVATASEALHSAYDALLGAGDDAGAAAAAVELIGVTATDLDRPEDGQRWADTAEALAKRSAVDNKLVRDLHAAISDLRKRRGDDVGAREHAELALSLTLEIEGPDDPAAMTYSMNLANSMAALGDYEGAAKQHEAALAIGRRTLGSDHVDLGLVLGNLGGVYVNLARYPEAVATLREAQALLAADGRHRYEEAMMTSNLAAALRATGDAAAALAEYEHALALTVAIYGEDHPTVAILLQNMGNAQGDLGRHEESNASHARAVRIYEDALGPDHPRLAAGLSARAVAVYELGDVDTARELFERSLSIAKRSLGAEHPTTSRYLNNYGGFLVQTLHAEEGLAYLRQAEEVRRKTIGPDHPDYGNTRANIGDALLELGRYAEAEVAYRDADRIAQLVFPDGSPDWMHPQLGLMRVEAARGDAEAALARSPRVEALLTGLDDELARGMWLLARSNAEVATGQREAARQDARAATEAFEGLGKAGTAYHTRARAWLDELP